MSHFTVLVIGAAIEEQLAPFMENCCDTPDRKFMEFTDMEDEFRKEYDTQSAVYFLMPDGRKLLEWEFDKLKQPRDGIEKREIPHKEIYATFEDYVAKWHGHKSRDSETNRYGYWQNPNAKWDWYQIGGRWTGFFKLKPGKTGELGERSWASAGAKPGHVDQALKGDIDFEGMRKAAGDRAGENWDRVNRVIEGLPAHIRWDKMRDEVHKGNIDAARAAYHEQPKVQAFQKLAVETKYAFIGPFCSVDDYDMPRKQYVEQARNNAVSTHAVVKDGKWIERGTMGWFAMVHDEKDNDVWLAEFNKALDALPDDTVLTIVDCHI